MIIGPWGNVLAELKGMDDHHGGDGDVTGVSNSPHPDLAIADIDVGLVDKVRREVSLKRRTDVYPEI